MLRVPLGDEGEETYVATRRFLPEKRQLPRVREDEERVVGQKRARLTERQPLQSEDSEPENDDDGSSSSSSSNAGCGSAPAVVGETSAWRVTSLGFDTLCASTSAFAPALSKQAITDSAAARVKRPYSGASRRKAAAAAAASRPMRRRDHENGMSKARVSAVLRRQACYCKKHCFRHFELDSLMRFLCRYWSLPKTQRDGLLALTATSEFQAGGLPHTAKDGPMRTSWSFLGIPIGPRCLAAVLGHNVRKLRRRLLPDGRLNPRVSLPGKGEVDAFFTTQYMSVAETLPTKSGPQKQTPVSTSIGMMMSSHPILSKHIPVARFVRRALTRKHAVDVARSLDSDSESDMLQSGNESEGTGGDGLKSWLETSRDFVWQVLSPEKMPMRFLPPGNVTGLYHEYVAWQFTWGRRPVSCRLLSNKLL